MTEEIEIWHLCKGKTGNYFKVEANGITKDTYESFLDAVMEANYIRKNPNTQILVRGSAVYNNDDVERILRMMGRVL